MGQTFTDVQPVAAQQQTFSNVTPIGQPSVSDVLTQPTEKTDAEYKSYRGATGVAGATVKGLNDVARGTQGAVKSAAGMFAPPEDATESVIGALGPGALPAYRGLRGLFSSGAQAAQVPAAIHDINQSPDPLTHYADAAQDTASQGAGQALTALGTEGLSKAVPAVAGSRVGRVAGKVAKGTIEDIPGVRQVGKIGQYWKDTVPAPTTYPGAPLPETPPTEVLHPEVASPSRTLPGQVAPEVIKPPMQQPAAPIPSRSGLSLPAAPKGAELTDVPATGAKPAPRSVSNQSGEALRSVATPQASPAADTGAPLPANPPGLELNKIPATGAKPASQSGEALAQTPQRGSIAEAMQPKPITRGSLQQMLEESLGATKLNPKVPIRQQLDITMPKANADLPEGHTAVNSSALKSYKYDPSAHEFHAQYAGGGDTVHVFGDVSPDEAATFERADSKGQAMQVIKQSRHPLVAKIVGGKRIPVRAAQ